MFSILSRYCMGHSGTCLPHLRQGTQYHSHTENRAETLRFAAAGLSVAAAGLSVAPRTARTTIDMGFVPAPERVQLDLRPVDRVTYGVTVHHVEAVDCVLPAAPSGGRRPPPAPTCQACWSAPRAARRGHASDGASAPAVMRNLLASFVRVEAATAAISHSFRHWFDCGYGGCGTRRDGSPGSPGSPGCQASSVLLVVAMPHPPLLLCRAIQSGRYAT